MPVAQMRRPGLSGPRRGLGPAWGRPRLQLYGQAWMQALETARRLVSEFGAVRVIAIGDLLHPEGFGSDSEVELVAWGLRADVFAHAAATGRPDAVPAVIHDGDRLAPPGLARVHAEGVELARRLGD